MGGSQSHRSIGQIMHKNGSQSFNDNYASNTNNNASNGSNAPQPSPKSNYYIMPANALQPNLKVITRLRS